VQSRIDRSGAMVATVDFGLVAAIFLPLLAIQLLLVLVALRDLLRPERRVKGDNKWLWALIIVLGEVLGPLLYFAVGRENE
jgi:drug/metabolite transporter (DMT)-like permease